MPGGVLCARSRLVLSQAVGRHLLAASRASRTRTFSAASSDEPYISVSPTDSGPRTVWPDESMGPFGPQDQRFQLPGNVGFDCHLEGLTEHRTVPVHRTVPDVLTAPNSSERHQFILAQFVNEFQGKLGPVSMRVHKAEQYFDQTETESETVCSIHSCPELLRRDVELMFPSATSSPSIIVVTVSHRAQSSGKPMDQLLNTFVSGAKEMCFSLWTAGYWADFIHPDTGAPFFSSPYSPSVEEVEPRHYGFHIDASDSCTVIRHMLRGTPLFTGTVFTNAPPHSAAVARLRGLLNVDDEQE